jgi:PAS domain S-box-containing protein
MTPPARTERRFFLSGLRARLFALVLLALIPALGMILYTAWEQRQMATREAKSNALRLARLIALEHKQLIDGAHQLLVALAQVPAVRDSDPVACSQLLASLLRQEPRFANLGVIKPGGEVACSALPAPRAVNVADRPYFRRALETRAFAIGEYQVGRITGKATLNFGYPALNAAGEVKGVVFAALDLDWLNRYPIVTNLPGGSALVVIDRNGTVLARSPEPERWVGKSAPETRIVRAILAQGEGLAEVPGVDGLPVIFGFTPLLRAPEAGGVYVAIGIPQKAVLAEINRALVLKLLGLSVVALLAFAAAWVGSDVFILRRVRALVGATKRLTSGDLTARTGLSYGGGELDHLAQAFDAMAGSLEQLTRQNRLILDAAGEGIFGLDLSGRVTFANPATVRMSGFAIEEMLGQPMHALVHHSKADGTPYPPGDCPMYATRADGVVRRVRDEVFWRKDGTSYPVEYVSTPIRERGEIVGAVVVFNDITEERQAQEALRQAETRQNLVLASLPMALYAAEPRASAGEPGFRATWISENVERITGLSPARFVEDPDFWASRLHPDDGARVRTAFEELASDPNPSAISVEYRWQAADGTYLWFLDHAALTRDQDGRARELSGTWLDITRRKRTEDMLRQSQKLAEMGSLLAGVAHELNNPLSVVLGYASLLRETVKEGPVAEAAADIAKAAERCARIVKNFLALARQQPPERRQRDLNQIVREAGELLAYHLRVENVEVRLELAPDLPLLWCDPHQLHQVLVNLITNAYQAMRESPGPRRLTLATQYEGTRERVALEVADTGPGIPPEIQARIFEPFFTTKPSGQGTGLGLSLCLGIIENHGGTIRITSTLGEGVVFRIELPLGTPAVEREARAPEAQRISGGKRILVVDDEPQVAALLVRMLALNGHQVETAATGAAALDKLRTQAYDLILSDMKMPELDGPGLYRALEQQQPELCRRFVFFTGDILSPGTRQFLEETGAPSLSKPFTLEEVRRVVQAALGAA